MLSLELKRNGKYFRRAFIYQIFGLYGAISLNTTERLMDFGNLVEILNRIFTEDKWEDYSLETYKKMNIFGNFIKKPENEFVVLPVDPRYNTVGISSLGKMVLGTRVMVTPQRKIKQNTLKILK